MSDRSQSAGSENATAARSDASVNAATDFAATLIATLIAGGVRDLIVCPGSRSQALALAAAEAERLGVARLHVRTDERSAAFFALGIARETGMPAPVIVTSGTAVANLMPAVLESHESRVPLMLVTADRPAEAHGVRTSQTTKQAGLFDRFTRFSADTVHATDDVAAEVLAERGLIAALGGSAVRETGSSGAAVIPSPGPVQLNLAFREPLSAAGPLDYFFAPIANESVAAELASSEPARDDAVTDSTTYTHSGDALAVVIAGEGAGAEAEEFAHAAGLPLLAEVVSGSRYGREAITGYATLIDDPAVGGLIEQAIVFGHPTLTRQVPALLTRDDVEVIVIDAHATLTSEAPAPHSDAAGRPEPAAVDSFNPGRRARIVHAARVADNHDARQLRRWLGAWVVPDRELREARSTVHQPDLAAATATGYKERSAYARAEVEVMREPVTRELLVESVWRATWPHDRLVLAASRLVRVLDALAQPRGVNVHANRGLAGIDGTIATGMGIAVASQTQESERLSAGTTRVLLGDLALLHDVTSLQLTPGELRPRIQLIVGNDGGGTIFDKLEVADSADAAAFDRVMLTPQNVQLEQLAAAYGWEYTRVTTRAELERLFTVPVTGPGIVEVPLSR